MVADLQPGSNPRRLSHSGNCGTPLATSDLSLDMYLPSNDAHRVKDEMLRNAPLALQQARRSKLHHSFGPVKPLTYWLKRFATLTILLAL